MERSNVRVIRIVFARIWRELFETFSKVRGKMFFARERGSSWELANVRRILESLEAPRTVSTKNAVSKVK
jgi:hypothetical protein